jgi:hypothetical protein
MGSYYCISMPQHASTYQQVRAVHVEEVLVLIHPHLYHASCVHPVGILTSWERVRVETAEDVAHTRAGDRFQGAPTLPHLKQCTMKICNNQLKSYGQPSPKEFLFSVV